MYVKTGPEAHLMCEEIVSSQWTPEQPADTLSVGRDMLPGLKTMLIPADLYAEQGGAAVLDFLEAEIGRHFM